MTNSSSIPENIPFADAIEFTQDLIAKMQNNQFSESELTTLISQLVKTQDGARGFFVSYLTDDLPFADHPSPAVLKALDSAPDTVGELLIKNAVMSSAMVIHHQRQADQENANKSTQVRSRSINLIKNLTIPHLKSEATEMLNSLTNYTGKYQAFLDKWGYDAEQKEYMALTMREALS